MSFSSQLKNVSPAAHFMSAVGLFLVAGAFGTESARATSETKCALSWASYAEAKSKTEASKQQYWNLVAKKRAKRSKKRRAQTTITREDYVLDHPPAFSGPKKPACRRPDAGPSTKDKKRARRPLPVVKDFLLAANRLYGFKPRRADEAEFMRRYAEQALSVGFNAQQIVGVYALETGGVGPSSRQSGIHIVNKKCKAIAPKGKAASTALGYAQLLAANSAVVLDENGLEFASKLEERARQTVGANKKKLSAKSALLRTMRQDVRAHVWKTNSGSAWRRYVAFGRTDQGRAVHALNLDADIGPMLQVQKLLKIKKVAQSRGHKQISAAQLELMNLVGYGRGLEMLRPVAGDVPTSNFFSRLGYERNPVAKNLTANGLLNRLGKIISRNLEKCGSVQFLRVFSEVERAKS